MLLPIHIAAGGLATIHRRSGLLFVYAMLVMGKEGPMESSAVATNRESIVAAV